MSGYGAALAAETVKARRARVLWILMGGFSIAPLAGGLFMVILKDPDRARQMGLIGQKAQIVAGTADWPAFLALLAQSVAGGGLIIFAFATAWIFGREFSDRTVRTLLALPTSRRAIVAAKATVAATVCSAMAVWVFVLGVAVGGVVGLPGWSPRLLAASAATILLVAGATIALQSVTAFLASAGRGYLAPIGWTFFSLVLANMLGVLGRGGWFPWAVPMLYTGVAGPEGEAVGVGSFVLLGATSVAGLIATFTWWDRADQAG